MQFITEHVSGGTCTHHQERIQLFRKVENYIILGSKFLLLTIPRFYLVYKFCYFQISLFLWGSVLRNVEYYYINNFSDKLSGL
jgi:hypothetical protein